MKIYITNLKDGEHTFHFEETPEEFELENQEIIVEIKDNVIIDVDLYKTANQFNLNISVEGKYTLQCDRCLEPYTTSFENNFELIYKIDFSNEASEEENDQDDILKYIAPNTQYIELKNDVRDYIILSVPMRKVPPEENGKCVVCGMDAENLLKEGENKAVNPVWEKLLKIKKN